MDFMPKIVYQDDNILLCRKPHGIASSRGQKECFLDSIKKIISDSNSLSSWTKRSEIEESLLLRNNQISVFGEEWEYGLLNRLDTVTAGLLYFARSYEAKAKYIHLQEQWWVTKTYYAQVYELPKAQFGQITTPIYHHRDDATRMTTDPTKWRWKWQYVTTYREKISHNNMLKINITSGCRHQIRCHLASIGHPIVWDKLYMTKWLKKQYAEFDEEKIELISAGLEMR